MNPPPSLLVKNEGIFSIQPREKAVAVYRGSEKREKEKKGGFLSDRLYKGRTVNCSEERKPNERDYDRFGSLRKRSKERDSLSRKINF